MICALLSWVMGAVCVVICGVRFARLRKGALQAEQLLVDARGHERSGRRLSESRTASRFFNSLREAREGPERIAELNEALAEVSRELDVGAALPASAARIAFSAGTLLGVVEIARTLPRGLPSIHWAIAAFAGGAIAALAAGQLGRASEREAARTRAAWNELGRHLARGMGLG